MDFKPSRVPKLLELALELLVLALKLALRILS